MKCISKIGPCENRDRDQGPAGFALLAIGGLLIFSLAGCVSVSGAVPGNYTAHPNAGIAQIECPPPARPECLPGRK